MKRFTVLLHADADEGGYTVSVPALPGCVTEGDDFTEALANAGDAIRLYLDDLEASGEPVPAGPRFETVEV